MAAAQDDPVTTWQRSFASFNPNCSESPVGVFAALWARAPCQVSPNTPCKLAYGTTYEEFACVENPQFFGILGAQMFAGNGLKCVNNLVTGSNVQTFASFTFSAAADFACQNTTEKGVPSSSAYLCNEDETLLTSESYDTDDCTGTPLQSGTVPMGCVVLKDTQVLVLSPGFCSVAGKSKTPATLRAQQKKHYTVEEIKAALPSQMRALL